MSWLDDIGSTVSGWFGGGSGGGSNIFGSLLSTALTGFALYKVNQSISASNNTSSPPPPPDLGNQISVKPDTQAKIPVVYGSAYVPGIITEAVSSNNNQTMTFVITLSEMTGTLLSDGSNSTFTFNDIYWNNNRVILNGDGITANYVTSPEGQIDSNINGLVKFYCYNGGSIYPVVPDQYTNMSLQPAYEIVPGWDSTYTMDELVFAVVQITYNRDAGVTGLPSISFNITNSLTQPGDCLQDYMTNPRYGAGINLTEIYSE